jgi:TatD DNase family protein
MVDVHCHLDLYPNPLDVAIEAERLGIYTIGVTNLPSHFIQGLEHLKTFKKVRLAIGMHPLYAHRHQAELSLFSNYVTLTSYIGEIGLDFSKAGIDTKGQQIESFEFVLNQVKNSKKILSLHSRGAEKEVLNYLIQYNIQSAIFHWYTGSLELINDITKAGYLFSVNPAMIKSNTGRNLVMNIPLENLLTESDGPFVQMKGKSVRPSDLGTVEEAIAVIKHKPIADVRNAINSNFQNLVKSLH